MIHSASRRRIVALALALAAVATPVGAATKFDSNFTPLSGGGATAVGDVDGDGNLDLVQQDAGLWIRCGHGDGTFGTRRYLPTGPFDGVAVADLDDDGYGDIIETSLQQPVVRVRIGIDGVTFGPPVDYPFPEPHRPHGVVAGDVNEDGHLDLVIGDGASTTPRRIHVFLGNGDGTLQAAIPQAVPYNGIPAELSIADLNADARLDLVVVAAPCASCPGAAQILLGSGNGTFLPAGSYAMGTLAKAAAVADLNGDDHLDIAIPNGHWFAGYSSVSVLRGHGDGIFDIAAEYYTTYESNPVFVAIDDFDNDDDPDLALVKAAGRGAAIVFNAGDGTFNTWLEAEAGGPRGFGAAGDFNGDGRLDLVAAGIGSSKQTSILLANKAGGFGTAKNVITAYATRPSSVAVGDLDGDGDLDWVAGARSSVGVYLNHGVDFAPPGPTPVLNGAEHNRIVHVVDINNDGALDVAAASAPGVSLWLARIPGQPGEFASEGIHFNGYRWQDMAVADINSDGLLDLVGISLESYPPEGFTKILTVLGSSNGYPPGPYTQQPGLPGQEQRALAVGDVDSDGLLDAVIATPTYAGVCIGDGAGALTYVFNSFVPNAPSSERMKLVDVDLDGNLDLICQQPSALRVLLGDGAMHFAEAYAFVHPDVWIGPSDDRSREFVVADLDGDGLPDIATPHPSEHRVNFWRGVGDGRFDSPIALGAGTTPTGIAVGDLNGDGRPDLAVANGESKTVSILWNRGQFMLPSDTNAGTQLQRWAWVSPNPSRGDLGVYFQLGHPANLRLEVFDVSGRLVRQLGVGSFAAGRHVVRWDGASAQGERVAAGVYYCVLRAAGLRSTIPMTVVR